MKKIYTILLLLISGVTTNFAQNNNDLPESEAIRISQDINKKILNVTYASEQLTKFEVKIKDEAGKLLYTMKENAKMKHQQTIDLSKFDKGIYFVEVDTERTNQVDRIELN
ncbi:MAG: Secretion system C-terminal sorting domain [Bacteroidetes bacterium]|jgi:spore germination protein YaaH|nr:Secretion system C-terminal sorting domain [Bacteroidota bacterium]